MTSNKEKKKNAGLNHMIPVESETLMNSGLDGESMRILHLVNI